MMKTIMMITVIAMCMLNADLYAAEEQSESQDIEKSIRQLLTEESAVSYSQKQPYSESIERMVIGFGDDGKPVIVLAVRDTKTYAQAKAIVAVTPSKDTYKIAAAKIPTIDEFKGKSQTLTKDALKDITGKVFKDGKDARKLVDAVTGATKYYKAIYVSYALMASKAIDELSDIPDWSRKPVQQ